MRELLFTIRGFVPTPSDTVNISPLYKHAFLYVGGAGTVKVTTAGGDDVTFTAVPAGTLLGGASPIAIKRVWAAGLTATNLVVISDGIV